MSGTEYHKITAPFVRFIDGPRRNQLDRTRWIRPEFELLQDLPWSWTEKIDGTNIRVIWDGHKVRFGGRTDGAQIPVELLDVLADQFPEELLEQAFQATPVVLYGEGFGAGIQSGGNYSPVPAYALFDVFIDPWWLKRDDVNDVAAKLGVRAAPDLGERTLSDAIDDMTKFGHKSHFGDFMAEGIVGRPPLGIRGRDGDRLLVKLKHKDLFQGDR